MLHEDLADIHLYIFHHSAFLAVAHTLIESFVASRSAAGAATVAVECAQATEASKLALWKAIMVGLQPILLDRLQWKLRVKVRGSCLPLSLSKENVKHVEAILSIKKCLTDSAEQAACAEQASDPLFSNSRLAINLLNCLAC